MDALTAHNVNSFKCIMSFMHFFLAIINIFNCFSSFLSAIFIWFIKYVNRHDPLISVSCDIVYKQLSACKIYQPPYPQVDNTYLTDLKIAMRQSMSSPPLASNAALPHATHDLNTCVMPYINCAAHIPTNGTFKKWSKGKEFYRMPSWLCWTAQGNMQASKKI